MILADRAGIVEAFADFSRARTADTSLWSVTASAPAREPALHLSRNERLARALSSP
jgi:hypothetical protein